MSRRRILPVLLALVLVASGARTAMLEVSLATIAKKAADIVQGEVIGQTSDWTFDGRTIMTEVTVIVRDALKGSLHVGDVVTVVVEGGEADGMGIRVEHQPRFAEAEEVVLFLKSEKLGLRTIQSLEQGKFSVYEDQTFDFLGRPKPLRELKTDIRLMLEHNGR